MHALLFEAASIQQYLFATGRLREIVGASELVEALCGPVLDAAITAVGDDSGEIEFARRAGAAFYAFSDAPEPLQKLAAAWPLLMAQWVPGLEFQLSLGSGDSAEAAQRDARSRLLGTRARSVQQSPLPGPFSRRSPRTGLAAAAVDRDGSPLDRASVRKRALAEGAELLNRFVEGARARDWPLDLSGQKGGRAFPFVGAYSDIAVVHADGNGLGLVLRRLEEAAKSRPDAWIGMFRGFSEAVGESTVQAARRAVAEVLEPVRDGGLYAMRPVLLGGDDLSVIIRADLAVPFTVAFISAFEEETAQRLGPKLAEWGIDQPSRLTACAGIAYMAASQPLDMALGLAESLCKAAKSTVKPLAVDGEVASAIQMHRVGSTSAVAWDDVWENEVSTRDSGASGQGVVFQNSLGAWCVQPHHSLPSLADLQALVAFIDAHPAAAGGLREVIGLVGRDSARARFRYRRLRQVAGSSFTSSLDDLLKRCCGCETLDESLPYAETPVDTADLRFASPVPDALLLATMQSRALLEKELAR